MPPDVTPAAPSARTPRESPAETVAPGIAQPGTADVGTAGPGVVDLGIVDALAQMSFLVQSVLGKLAAEHGLSIIQMRLLGVLRDREPGMQELARHLELDKSSVTGLVDRAERRGLVHRTPAPHDGRAVLVSPTAEGRALARVAAAEAGRRIQALTADLTEAQRARLSLLASIVVGGGAPV